jgi:hypothetical protein
MEICYSFKVSGFDGKTACATAEVTWSSITAVDHKKFNIIFNWHVGIFLPEKKF